MRVGFTGTRRGMTAAQILAILPELEPFYSEGDPSCWFHHGDAIGADQQAFLVARQMGWMIVAHPAYDEPRRSASDLWDIPRHPLARDKVIAQTVQHLIATPATMQEELRSGTWATVRYARAEGRSITVIFPDGSTQRTLAR